VLVGTIPSATYYKLKTKYAGMNVSDLKRMKALEAENRRLKSMYADISLEHKILKEILEKKYPELIDAN
jgi:putative transposase